MTVIINKLFFKELGYELKIKETLIIEMLFIFYCYYFKSAPIMIALYIYLFINAFTDLKEKCVYRIIHLAFLIEILLTYIFLNAIITDVGVKILTLSAILLIFYLTKAVALGDIFVYALTGITLFPYCSIVGIIIFIIISQIAFMLFNIRNIKVKSKERIALCPYIFLAYIFLPLI